MTASVAPRLFKKRRLYYNSAPPFTSRPTCAYRESTLPSPLLKDCDWSWKKAPPTTWRGCCACSRVASWCCSTALGASLKRSEEHTSELQSRGHLVCRLLLEKK